MTKQEDPTVVKAEEGWHMRLTSIATLAHPEGAILAVGIAPPTKLTERFTNGQYVPAGSERGA